MTGEERTREKAPGATEPGNPAQLSGRRYPLSEVSGIFFRCLPDEDGFPGRERRGNDTETGTDKGCF